MVIRIEYWALSIEHFAFRNMSLTLIHIHITFLQFSSVQLAMTCEWDYANRSVIEESLRILAWLWDYSETDSSPSNKQKIVSMVSMESLLDGQFHSSVCKRRDCNGKIQMAIWCVYSTFRWYRTQIIDQPLLPRPNSINYALKNWMSIASSMCASA